MLYENKTGYIDALEHAWTSSIALSGFLLEGGLMARASTEMDLPAGGMERMESIDRSSRVFDKPANFDTQIGSRSHHAQQIMYPLRPHETSCLNRASHG